MKKSWFVFVILFFTNNLLCQVFYSGKTGEYEGLGIMLHSFSTDYYLYGKQIRNSEFERLIRTNPLAQKYYIHGKNLRTCGSILAVPSVIVLGTATYFSLYGVGDRKISAISFVTLVIGVIMEASGRSKLRKSVDAYNNNDYGLKIGHTKNGIGLVLSF